MRFLSLVALLLTSSPAWAAQKTRPRLPESGERLLAFVRPAPGAINPPVSWNRLFDASARPDAVSADGIPGGARRPAAQWQETQVPKAYRRTFRILMGRQAEIDRFDPIILKEAQKHRLSPRLLKAIIAAESEFRTAAVSPAGALGLMQIMPRTGEYMGVARHQLFDPTFNIAAGAAYMADLFARAFKFYKLSGDYLSAPRWVVLRVLACYNAGLKFLKMRPLFTETRLYVNKVLWYLSSDVSRLRSASL